MQKDGNTDVGKAYKVAVDALETYQENLRATTAKYEGIPDEKAGDKHILEVKSEIDKAEVHLDAFKRATAKARTPASK